MSAIAFRQVEHLLIVGASRQEVHQPVRFGHALQQLIRRIDPLDFLLDRPRQHREQQAEAGDPDGKRVSLDSTKISRMPPVTVNQTTGGSQNKLITHNATTPIMLPTRLRP